ncbi:hypothetical protein F4823DRAFT_583130 [Ustulina deusta]|nr:hypothetical protein F4823DRAFT_583130 [Ustulina deusta]
MRVSFRQRRRTLPGFQIPPRADERLKLDTTAAVVPVDDESPADELSDDESSDDEDSDDEGGVGTRPSTSLGPGTTTMSTSSHSTLAAAPTTTLLTTTTLPPLSSTLISSSVTPIVSTSTSTLGDLTISTFVLPQSTSDGSTNVPQTGSSTNPPDDTAGSTSKNSQRAGQIAGGTIGGIAFIGLAIFAIWTWRRRCRSQANHLSRASDASIQYLAEQPRGPGKSRSPSSIMNQLMTAAYAAEDGQDYRNSGRIVDNYANEKRGLSAYGNESTERLTAPAAAQLRPPSIAGRTETTNETESTWKTWGVLAGSSRISVPRNWWVDRYFRMS